jgi:hypothetical protein
MKFYLALSVVVLLATLVVHHVFRRRAELLVSLDDLVDRVQEILFRD